MYFTINIRPSNVQLYNFQNYLYIFKNIDFKNNKSFILGTTLKKSVSSVLSFQKETEKNGSNDVHSIINNNNNTDKVITTDENHVVIDDCETSDSSVSDNYQQSINLSKQAKTSKDNDKSFDPNSETSTETVFKSM